MIKGQSVRVYYPAIQSPTGHRVTGDAGNHTVYVTYGASVINLTSAGITPVELTTGTTGLGEYTFELPGTYTNADLVSVIVTSSNTLIDVIIPPIELTFEDPIDISADVSDDSIQAITDSILDASVGNTTVETALAKSYTSAVKFEAYPTGGNLANSLNIPSADTIASKVLSTSVTDSMCENTYSLAGMIMGGFKSSMTPSLWTIFTPGGSQFFTRVVRPDDDLKPVAEVY